MFFPVSPLLSIKEICCNGPTERDTVALDRFVWVASIRFVPLGLVPVGSFLCGRLSEIILFTDKKRGQREAHRLMCADLIFSPPVVFPCTGVREAGPLVWSRSQMPRWSMMQNAESLRQY